MNHARGLFRLWVVLSILIFLLLPLIDPAGEGYNYFSQILPVRLVETGAVSVGVLVLAGIVRWVVGGLQE
jgi:hypothetical protein